MHSIAVELWRKAGSPHRPHVSPDPWAVFLRHRSASSCDSKLATSSRYNVLRCGPSLLRPSTTTCDAIKRSGHHQHALQERVQFGEWDPLLLFFADGGARSTAASWCAAKLPSFIENPSLLAICELYEAITMCQKDSVRWFLGKMQAYACLAFNTIIARCSVEMALDVWVTKFA